MSEVIPGTTQPQNRAVALRQRTITGALAIQVYEIIKNSAFLNKRPELRDRLSKAFAEPK